MYLVLAVISCIAICLFGQMAVADLTNGTCDTRNISGWTVHVDNRLFEGTNVTATTNAIRLLTEQLDGIVRVVPQTALAELQKVPLWLSPEYPGISPKAEYHPDVGWLRNNGRNPGMVKNVEFTNISIFDREIKRMPVFVLHELAHAYHDRVLGFDEPRIKALYEKTRVSDKYDNIERRNWEDQTNTFERAYAMKDHKEYFAETTEAFFGCNDMFPFKKDELKKYDPEMFSLLGDIWGCASVKLKVATYNIHGGRNNDGKLDLQGIADVIKVIDPDVIALQEVDRNTRRAGKVDQAAELSRLTGLKHHIFCAALGIHGGEYGIALLSRFPISSVETNKLPKVTKVEDRVALRVLVQADADKPLTFIATHLDNADETNRVLQAGVLAGMVPKDGAPAILMGDINATEERPPIDMLRSSWTLVEQPFKTFSAEMPKIKIDHVLYAPGSSFRVVGASAGGAIRPGDSKWLALIRLASDHLPVVAELDLK